MGCSVDAWWRQTSISTQPGWESRHRGNNLNTASPFHDGVVGPHPGGQQVVPVVEQLVVFAAVSDPQVGHGGNAAGQAQQVLLGAAVLVRDQQALVRRFTLAKKKRRSRE